MTAELELVTAQLAQKQVVIDRYFTDYETGKLDRTPLEGRIEKVSLDLAQLRRRRDEIQLLLDATPEPVTRGQLNRVAGHVKDVIDTGDDSARMQLCAAPIDEFKIDLGSR